MQHVQAIGKTCAQFPDQWVLIGNPELRDPQPLGTVVSKLIRGVVLLAGKDKQEIARRASEFRTGFERYSCIYTGQIPANRRLLILPAYTTVTPNKSAPRPLRAA